MVGVWMALAVGTSYADQVAPHAGMLQYPDVSSSDIVFVYANDLWRVPRAGGTATPLASPPGKEAFPKFSPDGATIAFIGNYDGNRDLYTIPVAGGVPFRVTYHPTSEVISDWSPDGRLIFSARGMNGYPRAVGMYMVDSAGGLPEQVAVPYGANGTISADRKWLAYTPHSRDARTWKRYRGGMATDIWLFNLSTHKSKKITNWEGTDSIPMWHGRHVYYLSDGGENHRLNIWRYDTKNGRVEQITRFKDFDVKWPSIGPGPSGQGEIVFQLGPELQLLNLETEQSAAVSVLIPGDLPKLRAKSVDASKNITNMRVSPSGKRAVAAARGDIWTLPAKDGSPRNLTRTSGVAERDPSWSPDGRWIAYFSDATGEYELYIMQSDGKGETRQLTKNGSAFRYEPTWTPDSKMIAFGDKTGRAFLHNVESGETKLIDRDDMGNISGTFSQDSAWFVYAKSSSDHQSAIWLYNAESGEKHQVTSGMFADSSPVFDRKGEYLYYASNREISSPIYENLGTTFVYANTGRLMAVPLRADIKSPLAPKSDEEEWDKKDADADEDAADEADEKDDANGDKADEDDAGNDADDKADAEPLKIDIEGFERRAIILPMERGNFSNLAVNDKGQLLYVRRPRPGTDEKSSIKLFDLSADKKEEKTVAQAGGFDLSADGKKILAGAGGKFAIVDAKADQKLDKPISTSGMNVTIDPQAEWRQIYNDAWRMQRDFFYDPGMHGVDWQAVHEQYAAMLDDCRSREDVSFVIREMISELNVGHTYYFGGDVEHQPSVSVGMLGCDFAYDAGAYRIAKIYEGGPWDADARGPLSQPGVDVKSGDYLLAVNGVPVETSKAPWAAFQGLAGKVVTLTLSDKPEITDDVRDVVVKLAAGESNLRYRAWVEKSRAHVDKKSGGKVGYIYVPNTGVDGQNELFRQFYGQIDKKALIIDERWNGGGQIPSRFIELLNRPATNSWARRDHKDWTWPPDSQQGPKCMLINGLAGSGGDCFPYYFRQAGLGKLIGTRTWGGLVGISGNPGLIDGGYTSVPTFAFYENDGTWGIEGYGVPPDIEVIDDPALMTEGGDPQLDAAIAQMLQEIKTNGYTPPSRPKYPNRSGMGVREEDK